ncbi:MAG TPA: hypothetical protein V6C81_13165 [Planktothrix sp.]|jgi:hypothetical protein
MYINTRRNTVANRVNMAKIFLIAACLLLFKPAFAQQSTTHADHDYFVHRCVERAVTEAPGESAAQSTARCERLQSAIDATFGTYRLTESWRLAAPCDKGVSGCKSDDFDAHGVSTNRRWLNSYADDAGFARIFDHKLASDCIGLGCMSDRVPSMNQYDQYEWQRQFRYATVSGTDYFADLIHPGLGRWERHNNDIDYRLDFFNPRRCSSKGPKVGLCFSMTMP